jgi:nucleoside-diphosphate-sugar epimerase
MRVFLTGAFGNVGTSAVAAHLTAGDELVLFEADTPRNRRTARRREGEWRALGPGKVERVVFGDIRDRGALVEAMRGTEDMGAPAGFGAVVHLAAVIPPLADRRPDLARSVNIEGTRALLEACGATCGPAHGLASGGPPRFVLASSIAAYGDRLGDYWICSEDPLCPGPEDAYGQSKVEAEALVRRSGLPFSILRLSYVVSRKKLDPDPLLFHMPLATKIEVCHTEDVGRAFAAAAREEAALGATFDIGGGPSCRTTYRDYLDRMFGLFGLGGAAWLPERAFARSGFHCGWYADSDRAQASLRFQRKGLGDYYDEVREEARWIRLGARLAAPILRARLLASSPFFAPRARKA